MEQNKQTNRRKSVEAKAQENIYRYSGLLIATLRSPGKHETYTKNMYVKREYICVQILKMNICMCIKIFKMKIKNRIKDTIKEKPNSSFMRPETSQHGA